MKLRLEKWVEAESALVEKWAITLLFSSIFILVVYLMVSWWQDEREFEEWSRTHTMATIAKHAPSSGSVWQDYTDLRVLALQASPLGSGSRAKVVWKAREQDWQQGQVLAHHVVVDHIDHQQLRLRKDDEFKIFTLTNSTPAAAPSEDTSAAVGFFILQLHAHAQGLEVRNASSQGLLARLGLQEGDVISELNGQTIHSADELQLLLQHYHPKQVLSFKGKRDGRVMSWTYQAQADD